MQKGFAALCVVISLVAALSADSFAMDLTIMTGGEKGTYYQFGLNLKELVEPMGIDLEVLNSTGSIENLYTSDWTIPC